MAINIVGTYVSENGEYVLDITESISSVGQFRGTFTAKNTPEGEVVYQINNSVARWAYTSDMNHAGIGFMVVDRAEVTAERTFVLFDSWAGSINSKNVLVMNGSRSYNKNEGEYNLFSFENILFTRK